MITNIDEILKESIEEINAQLTDEEQLVYTPEEELLGNTGKLDSLSFVTLVSIIEEKLLDSTGKKIYLVTDKAFSQKYSPFKNIETLTIFIETLMKEVK
jgi:acyl carrier protein